ncbi:MAG: hypothetical protein O3B01_31730 [Planctomycetota bacterium]|nr:hypothetical protein [Planctomycetota bacterium]
MPIPPFDQNNVLPPHLGEPTKRERLSPYPCTTEELCQRFATSARRKTILEGLLGFRKVLSKAGFSSGFQWLDGSFLEQIELLENRPPGDLDIVTFYVPPDTAFNPDVTQSYPVLIDSGQIRANFHLDHYFVDISHNPHLTVDATRYWTGLFSHRRDGVWKGMLRIELNTVAEDNTAEAFLRSQP